MSERILRALMQLFAIIAEIDDVKENSKSDLVKSTHGIKIIESLLRTELSNTLIKKYIAIFESNLKTHLNIKKNNESNRKRTSVNSVKVLRICSEINQELTQRQKVIVLIRMFEFIQSNNKVSKQETEFVHTISESFNISEHEYFLIKNLQTAVQESPIDDVDLLYISAHENDSILSKKIQLESLDGEIRVFRIRSINTLFFKYFGSDEVLLNGQIISNDRAHILTQGSTLRTLKTKPIYHSDIVSRFLKDTVTEKITFKVDKAEYIFKNKKYGVHEVDFVEESGKLVGVMGGSGTGKSTFLNLLNGNLEPTYGNIFINGIDIHKYHEKIEGCIGFISQDDLLIEELTVFQNLYLNTKLCYKQLSIMAIHKKVIDLLHAVGLYEVKDLIVGTPLDKKLSGGQRKRLNIALELIREPSILFVDEPTSGLSSRDSEMIMDLLKDLTLKGKLIFVVIHQPSSDIFKMFDRLFILDQGGYLIYDGNPIDALVYFKNLMHHINSEERECSNCGNVNPEQIFNIIDAKVVDEYGHFTIHRKISPEEWHELYLENKKPSRLIEQKSKIKTNISRPSRIKQFSVFFTRDFLSKISNRQYIIINLIEAPLLAFFLSFFIKYLSQNEESSSSSYQFYLNENIPQYLFIAVIVALFLGLTVAAEEINKDKKILKREKFLNLSRSSYLLSKLFILFIISAIQTILFTLIGNSILEIKGMNMEYWGILFSLSCLANLMGLNISSAFNSAKVIYIIVPILIIPQLLFSGVIVKFDKLNPVLSNNKGVPWVGNVMASRWAYEALAVSQVKNNAFEKDLFELKSKKYTIAWKKNYWIPCLENQLNILIDSTSNQEQRTHAKTLISNEIQKETLNWKNLSCVDCISSTSSSNLLNTNKKIYKNTKTYLQTLKKYFDKSYIQLNNQIEAKIKTIGQDNYIAAKKLYSNKSLTELVTNRKELSKYIVDRDEIVQKENLIYKSPKNTAFFNTHFYAPYKYLFNFKLSTYLANIIVLWGMILLLGVALYFDWLKKIIDFSQTRIGFYKWLRK
jgi:ABC transport system ATP-binding/permease protein